MLSRDLLREQPEQVRERLASRGVAAELLDSWLQLDRERREALVEVEDLQRRRNEPSRDIGAVKQRGGDATAAIAAVSAIKERAAVLEARLQAIEPELARIDL